MYTPPLCFSSHLQQCTPAWSAPTVWLHPSFLHSEMSEALNSNSDACKWWWWLVFHCPIVASAILILFCSEHCLPWHYILVTAGHIGTLNYAGYCWPSWYNMLLVIADLFHCILVIAYSLISGHCWPHFVFSALSAMSYPCLIHILCILSTNRLVRQETIWFYFIIFVKSTLTMNANITPQNNIFSIWKIGK